VLTRMRVAGGAVALVAAGSLAAGLAAAWSDKPAGPAAAGLAARPATSPGSPGQDNVDADPAAPGAAKRPRRPAGARGSAGKDQPNAGSAPAAAVSSRAASPRPASPRPTATSSSPSYYIITNNAHDLCLNAMNNVDTAQVDVATCNGSWYQDWTGLKDGSAEEVVNKESGLCLNAKSVANDADVDIATCNGSSNQLWLPDGARLYLAAASSGLCLRGDSPATNESPAGAAGCASGTSQEWSW
jgi:Ricin-type beta-trefoil lectin domain